MEQLRLATGMRIVFGAHGDGLSWSTFMSPRGSRLPSLHGRRRQKPLGYLRRLGASRWSHTHLLVEFGIQASGRILPEQPAFVGYLSVGLEAVEYTFGLA